MNLCLTIIGFCGSYLNVNKWISFVPSCIIDCIQYDYIHLSFELSKKYRFLFFWPGTFKAELQYKAYSSFSRTFCHSQRKCRRVISEELWNEASNCVMSVSALSHYKQRSSEWLFAAINLFVALWGCLTEKNCLNIPSAIHDRRTMFKRSGSTAERC